MHLIFETNDSELIELYGKKVVDLEELCPSQYDKSDLGMNMYSIKLENGKKLQAFANELVIVI